MSEQQEPGGEFILYTTDDGQTRVACRFEAETIWLSQALMAELFQSASQNPSTRSSKNPKGSSHPKVSEANVGPDHAAEHHAAPQIAL